MNVTGWTRNSRFWRITPWVVLLSALLALYFDDPAAFIAVTSPWITVAGGKSMVSTYRGSEPAPRTGAVAPARPVPGEGPHEYESEPPGGGG